MPFIAGGYTVTYKGAVLGQIEDGINLEYTHEGEVIRGDILGDTIQDFVIRGGSCYMDMTLIEFDAVGARAAFWYHDPSVFGVMDPANIGKLATALAGILLLTKVTGPNATPSPITAAKALLAPGFPVKMIFAPRLRRVPLRFLLLPDVYGSLYRFFAVA